MHEHFDPGLLAFLRDPASYPHHPSGIREIHTHASLVFVAPPFVYKIKKPVNFGFLDFSTPEKRRHFCLREVELNSRLSPGVYLSVETITRAKNGFAFNGRGPVVEHALRMRELSGEGFLDARVRAGTAGEAELERVARTLAAFYRKQPSPPEIAGWGSVGKLRLSTDENFRQTRAFIGHTLSRAAFDAIRAFTNHCLRERAALFAKRVAEGRIRDCHGDLHLDHVHVTADELHIYDCIEFNDRFRHLDIASDVAFLAMDLDFHGRPDLSRFFTRRIAELTGDEGLEPMLDFYQCYRAYVRGKVESMHSVAEIGDPAERAAAADKARLYFQLALRYATLGTRPPALAVIGRVASGKSTLAANLARELGLPRVSSDELRKQLAGLPLCERGDAARRALLYTPEMTARVYAALLDAARRALDSGRGVILDATYSKRACRDHLRAELGDDRLRWILAAADETSARRRLARRDHLDDVVSDARLEDQPLLDAAFEKPDEIPQILPIPTRRTPPQTARSTLTALAQLQAHPPRQST